LFGTVFENSEVFFLKAGDVITGLVGDERGNKDELGAGGEFDVGVVLFVFGFGENKNGTSQGGHYGDVAESLTTHYHDSHTPLSFRENDGDQFVVTHAVAACRFKSSFAFFNRLTTGRNLTLNVQNTCS